MRNNEFAYRRKLRCCAGTSFDSDIFPALSRNKKKFLVCFIYGVHQFCLFNLRMNCVVYLVTFLLGKDSFENLFFNERVSSKYVFSGIFAIILRFI